MNAAEHPLERVEVRAADITTLAMDTIVNASPCATPPWKPCSARRGGEPSLPEIAGEDAHLELGPPARFEFDH